MFESYWLPDYERYLLVFVNSEGDYEYTIYRYDLSEDDGGIIAGFLTQDEALRHILELHDMFPACCDTADEIVTELDYETFECLIENKEALR